MGGDTPSHFSTTLDTFGISVEAPLELRPMTRLPHRNPIRQSYPDIVRWHHLISGPCSGCAT